MTGFIRGSTSLHSKQLVCLRVVCGGVVCLQARSRVTRVPDRETQTTSVEIVFICKFRLSIATVKNLSFTLSLSYIKANVHRIALKNREYRSLGTLETVWFQMFPLQLVKLCNPYCYYYFILLLLLCLVTSTLKQVILSDICFYWELF